MKKIIVLFVCVFMALPVYLNVGAEEIRVSASISQPSKYFVAAGEDVRYTITFSDALGMEISLDPQFIITNFKYSDMNVIKISSSTYDVIFKDVTASAAQKCNIVLEKGIAVTADGRTTITTPHSGSFVLLDSTSKRSAAADYMMDVVLHTDSIEALKDTGLMLGDENGALLLDDIITEQERYILNRRVENYWGKQLTNNN